MAKVRLVVTWAFGIVLPVITLGVELVTDMCGDAFFDPIPSFIHVLLSLCVPLGNFVLLRAVARGEPPMWVFVLHGVALGVAAFYTLLFLPLLPIGLVGLLFLGLGLLPLTPILSFTATLLEARRTRAAVTGWWLQLGPRTLGFGLAVLVLFGADARTAVTRAALVAAVSDAPQTRRTGLTWLRAVGSEDTLRRLCDEQTRLGTDIVGFLLTVGNPVDTQKARQVYYRVTGRAFDSVSAPARGRRRGRWNRWDFGQGGETVGGVLDRLDLDSSRIDVTVDPIAALYYTEWTLEFRNESEQQQEARAQIQLPPDGVVTRLTLWVAGEEREAAFAGRGAVRQAYQSVVQARRDPVLVTTSGPERVMIQCFPVPPHGTMKTRVGIVAPLQLASLTQGMLGLPHFLERNFGVRDAPLHSVWIETGSAAGSVQRQMLLDSALAGAQGRTAVARPPLERAWTAATAGGETAIVHQSLVARPAWRPQRVVLVADGSRALDGLASEIGASLAALTPETEIVAIVAGDDVTVSSEIPKAVAAARPAIETLLRATRFRGGADNVPALVRAWDLAAAVPESAIVWVHGPQPVVIERLAPLRQAWERRPGGPRLFSVAVVPGANRVLESLDGIAAVRTAPRLESAGRSLAALFEAWSPSRTPLVAERTRDDAAGEGAPAQRASDHLVRLWARDAALSLLDGSPAGNKAGIALAARYRLVTAVTGAVVLETQQQYDAAGLDPDDPTQVSSVPEPELWLLLAVVGAVLMWTWRQRRTDVARLA